MSEIRFDRTTVRRLIALLKPFFMTSEVRWYARGMVLLLAAFSISNSLINVLMSYVNRDMMTALSLKEQRDFIQNLLKYLLAFACATPFIVFYRFTEERLALLWRKSLSQNVLERYFTNQAYYKINAIEGIDNPDQRIEEDIRSFTSQTLSILLIIFNALINLVVFTGILFSITSNLVLAVVGYAIFGTLTTYFLGRPLISLNFQQLRKEADYRYKLVNIRDNAESIAFYRDEAKEYTRARQRLRNALRNLLQIIKRNRKLNFFTTNYNFLIGLLPTVIVAPLYLRGEIEFGVVYQAGAAFVQVVNALSIIVLNFQQVSNLTAVLTRLGTFQEALETASKPRLPGKPAIHVHEAPYISFDKVSIHTPRGQIILSDISFMLREGHSLLITGPSGSGKSSIMRVTAGLWDIGTGHITRPKLHDTIFLPQRPYMILGTFRSQMLYGIHDQGLTEAEIADVVERVGLSETVRRVGGMNAQVDWPNFLSIGEQQRIGFGRLLLARRRFAFLDEASTALDERSEIRLYDEIRKFSSSFVSIGYRASLMKQHTHVLEIDENGSWSIRDNP